MTTHTQPKAPGTPTWIDLTAPDAPSARSFYGALFGWEYDVSGPEYGNYATARVGQRQIWTVTNDTEWDHPWHQHGFFFMVLDENNQPVKPMVWKDTVNIPMKSTVRFIVDFDERPGMWMFHCHILDHAEGGLMGHVDVAPAGTTENQAPRPGVHHHGVNPGARK